MENWKELIEEAMAKRGETLADLEFNTLTDDEMVREFDSSYGCTEGVAFTAWTVKSVYFPICYDGAEWVGSVSRHPDGKPTKHQGGG
jgi:hypothetical protein